MRCSLNKLEMRSFECFYSFSINLKEFINSCVIECYFRDHIAEKHLLFLDDLAPHLECYDSGASDSKQREFLAHLQQSLNAPSSKIRNRLLRLTADSPYLLAVIKAEGKV